MAGESTSTYVTNAWLNTIRGGALGTSFTAPSAVYAQLHTATPGANGTTSIASVTTRVAATFGAAAGGSLNLSNTPTWASWAGTNGQVISHISFWDALTGGNFLWSAQLAVAKTINTGDTFTLSAATLTIVVAV